MSITYSIECWIFDAGQRVLLLQVPARTGKHEAFWQPITGGIENTEAPREAAHREITEETGLTVSNADLIVVASQMRVVISADLTISKTIFAATAPHTTVTTNPREHQAHQWLSPAQVTRALFWDSNRETWNLVSQHQFTSLHDEQ